MREVEVDKEQLIATLVANKVTHEADWEIAWEAFREKAMKNCGKIIESLKKAPKGGVVELYVGLQPPENHSDDYKRALEMCEWERSDYVTLTEGEFKCYVQDQWGWKAGFETSNAFYTGSTSPSSIHA